MKWNNGHEFVTAYWYALIYSSLISIWQRWLPFRSFEAYLFCLYHWTLTPFDNSAQTSWLYSNQNHDFIMWFISHLVIFGVGLYSKHVRCSFLTCVFINTSVYHDCKPLGVERIAGQRRGKDGCGDRHDVMSCNIASFIFDLTISGHPCRQETPGDATASLTTKTTRFPKALYI